MAEGADQDSKTEEPTQKRLDDARRKGQVAVSREVNHWFMFLAGTAALLMLAPPLARGFTRTLAAFLERPHQMALDTPGDLVRVSFAALAELGGLLLPLAGLFMVAAVAGTLLQGGFVMAPERLKPKFSNISPGQGFKKLFGGKAIVEFLKGLVKLVAIGVGVWFAVRPYVATMDHYIDMAIGALLGWTMWIVAVMMFVVLGGTTLFAAIDLFYQRIMHRRQLRMTREELKEEFKESEGDPIVKGRLKRLRQERARRRMMAEVPKASVVVTNPTHFSVALRYDALSMAAPRVVAKGADLVALRIRELAKQHGVPVIANPPLARALFASVELDQEIPPDHYRAVAEIITYVMKLRGSAAART